MGVSKPGPGLATGRRGTEFEQAQAALAETEARFGLLAQLAQIGERMESVRKAFAGAEGEEEEGGEREFKGRGVREILMARRALKMALHEKKHSSPEEYQRIAAILMRAADEIRGG